MSHNMSPDLPTLDLPQVNGLKGNGEVYKVPSSSSLGLDTDDEDLNFDSPQDEAAHYREKYRRIMDALDETRAELDEFQASSKELEDELEKELAATEKQRAELKEKIKRLEVEKEEWRAKHVALQKMHSSTVGNMQREMDNLRSERDRTLVALRDLEMGNDELERNERVAVSSLLDLESKYNRAIEEKTLLEQEVVQRQELEEECQRLKDDLRDANTEIAILRDQATQSVPTPPSSVSMPMSPAEGPGRDLSSVEPLDLPAQGQPQRQRPSKLPHAELPRMGANGLPRSPTVSSIPTMSPSAKKLSSMAADSPVASMSRSSTARHLTANGITASPSLRRVKAGLPAPSPARATSANLAAKNKGFKLLHELQARLKATDDKLGTKVPKRNVSAPIPNGQSKRNISSFSAMIAPSGSKATHSRVAALQRPNAVTPMADGDKSGATFLSPHGWVFVDDEETPTNQGHGMPHDPVSPLQANFRSTSSASTSSKPLPSRPGIPSPLASSLSKSTRTSSRASNLGPSSRPPSRLDDDGLPTSRSMTKSDSGRFTSRSTLASSMSRSSSRQVLDSRPTSPSMIPTRDSRPMSPNLLHRSTLRSPTPNMSHVLSASTSRPVSRQGTRALGRGPPPSNTFPATPTLNSSTATPLSGFKRPKRRSSVGVTPDIAPTGIPAPKTSPGRPISVPVFGNTPPPVPRIPSAHLRESARRNGQSRDRPKSEFGMS